MTTAVCPSRGDASSPRAAAAPTRPARSSEGSASTRATVCRKPRRGDGLGRGVDDDHQRRAGRGRRSSPGSADAPAPTPSRWPASRRPTARSRPSARSTPSADRDDDPARSRPRGRGRRSSGRGGRSARPLRGADRGRGRPWRCGDRSHRTHPRSIPVARSSTSDAGQTPALTNSNWLTPTSAARTRNQGLTSSASSDAQRASSSRRARTGRARAARSARISDPPLPTSSLQRAQLLLHRAADLVAEREDALVDDPVVDVGSFLSAAEDARPRPCTARCLETFCCEASSASLNSFTLASPSRSRSSSLIRIGSPSTRKRRAINSTRSSGSGWGNGMKYPPL